MCGTAGVADRLVFSGRTRVVSRALGSPNIPWVCCSGGKPEIVYASANRRNMTGFAIRTACEFSAPSQRLLSPGKIGLAGRTGCSSNPHGITESQKCLTGKF
jgi:hypothetical protein